MEVKWTDHALLALEEMYNYGTKFSKDRSIDYATSLIEFCENLGQFPFKYPECIHLPHPDKKYRSAAFDKLYKIIYRVETNSNELFILDLFHTSRNPNDLGRLKNE